MSDVIAGLLGILAGLALIPILIPLQFTFLNWMWPLDGSPGAWQRWRNK